MTGNQRHKDHIATGQQLSRHTLPTLLYFLFSPPHIFFNSILASRTNGTFGFAPIAQANPSGNNQRAVSANARRTISGILKLSLPTEKQLIIKGQIL